MDDLLSGDFRTFFKDLSCDEISTLFLIDRRTPLHYACQHGRVDVAQRLITNCKCSIESKDVWGCTPLHIAARYGQVEMLRYLLRRLFGHEVSGLTVTLTPDGKLSHTLTSMFQQKLSDRHRDQSGNTPLHTACVHGQLDIVELLTREIGCDPNDTTSEGLSCLHLAAQHGHLPLVRYLVEEVGSDVTLEDEHGRSPTYLAAGGGHLDTLKYMIEEKGADPLFKISREGISAEYIMAPGRSLVHTASWEGHLHVVRYLVEQHGCDPSWKDGKEFTPLHLACQKGHVDVVSYLITEKHSDPNSTGEDVSNSPLHLAAWNGHLEVVRFLIEVVQCDPNVKSQNARTPLYYSSGEGHLDVVKYLVNTCHCDPLCPDEDGRTPLHSAADGGEVKVVKYILTPDEDLPRDKYNNTPLHYAASNNHLEVVKLYIEDMECDPNIQGQHGCTPLHFSLYRKCFNTSMYLIALPHCDVLAKVYDASLGTMMNPLRLAVETNEVEIVRHICNTRRLDPYLQDDIADLLATKDVAMLEFLCNYADPLNHAAAHGDLQTVRHNVEKGGWDPLEFDRHGMNALHHAAQNGQLVVVKYFTEEDNMYDLNTKDKHDKTPLHHASEQGSLDVVKCLLDSQHCDPLCEDEHKHTPLHHAAANNNLDVVVFLIEKINCDPNLKGKLNRTPLHLAIKNGHVDIAMYLIDLPHCDVLSTTSDGVNPLLLAVKEQHLEIVSYICSTRRLDPYFQPDGEKLLKATNNSAILKFLTNYPDPLHRAAVYGDVETVRHHVERKKWDPLKLDRYGNNTLHNAAHHGRLEVVKYLTGLSKDPINEGVEILCDPLVKNKYGLTAQDIASQNGHRHVASYLLRATSNQPVFQQDVISPTLCVFVVGNSGSGKSTLVKALGTESSLLGKMIKVKGVTPLTAGIVPVTLHSKVFGTVNIYDFAGHEEYYASHEVILCQTTQPLVILAVDISLPEQDVKKQVLYWLTILSNSSSSDVTKTMHVLIVGSHADQIIFKEKKEVYQQMKSWTRGSASSLKYHGFIQCDCRYSSSDNLNQLRLKLNSICKSIRLFLLAHESDHSNKHCAALMHHLEQNRPEQATITVRELFRLITESITPGSRLIPFADQNLLLQTCKELSSIGHLLFLPHDKNEIESVMILDKDIILSKVHACLQAKNYLTNKIGILNEEKLKIIVSHSLKGMMEPELAIKYLIFSQFCTEITANQLISVPENFTGIVHYFFPNVVSASRPADLLPLDEQNYTHFYTCMGTKVQ